MQIFKAKDDQHCNNNTIKYLIFYNRNPTIRPSKRNNKIKITL